MRYLGYILLTFLVSSQGLSQQPSDKKLRDLVEAFKKDPRGPFQAIRWFCPDGTVLPPNERCPQPGGIQHALPKDVVKKLSQESGIHLGQVLAGTPFEDFWDASNQHAKLKQYQLARFLHAVDEGWILRKAQYYRGAFQAEDEERWGVGFLKWLLAQDDVITSQFFLTKEACEDIPHNANDDRFLHIRALSKVIADSLPSFNDLRIKIHGQPDPGDVQKVRDFYAKVRSNLVETLDAKFLDLITTMAAAYEPFDLKSLVPYLSNLKSEPAIANTLERLMNTYGSTPGPQADTVAELRDIVEMMFLIRQDFLSISAPENRLAAMDLSIKLERWLFQLVAGFRPATIHQLLETNYWLAKAAVAAGFLEFWEWAKVEPILNPNQLPTELTFEDLRARAMTAGRIVDWGSGMVRAVYHQTVTLYSGFEPLAHGFIDDHVRASLLLALGETAAQLRDISARISGVSNHIMGIGNPGNARGINPGFATGELQVLTGTVDGSKLAADKIYAMGAAPMDLKPVAGIATVTEGNLVSHVQLLARNLGIPNAQISQQNLSNLAKFSGQKVFYAVSPGGAVIMKPESEMTEQEKMLISEQKRPDGKLMLATDGIDTEGTDVLNLRDVRAKDSGRICGPKAANLGELKNIFPENVVEGLVIPFGIFRQHLDQEIPNTGTTYWAFLQAAFKQGFNSSRTEKEAEKHIIASLAVLRKAIRSINLLPAFKDHLRQQFSKVLGTPIGQIPVFIRSDTNMEDLKEFTGAGLNLTVFNVVEEEKIFQAIRDVWASPYTDRSYHWRQKFLLNPENVYPSILILPSVNVDKSGVMITTGVASSGSKDLTIAFNLGVGGAVEGQPTEAYELKFSGENLLLSPSRAESFITLPANGGTQKAFTAYDEPILTDSDLQKLREFGQGLEGKLAGSSGAHFEGPYDVELGFKDDKVVLFQVRPFVENKQAGSSLYLRSLDPEKPAQQKISIDQKPSAG